MPRKTRKGITLIQQSRRIAPSLKATWHQIEGAGRRHVKREFFGLSDRDVSLIEARIQASMEQAIAIVGSSTR